MWSSCFVEEAKQIELVLPHMRMDMEEYLVHGRPVCRAYRPRQPRDSPRPPTMRTTAIPPVSPQVFPRVVQSWRRLLASLALSFLVSGPEIPAKKLLVLYHASSFAIQMSLCLARRFASDGALPKGLEACYIRKSLKFDFLSLIIA
jgi:hypothetical protein